MSLDFIVSYAPSLRYALHKFNAEEQVVSTKFYNFSPMRNSCLICHIRVRK